MTKALGGLNKNYDDIEKRKTCHFCGELFKSQEGKICPQISVNPEGYYYHPECWDEYVYKLTDYIHDPHKKED